MSAAGSSRNFVGKPSPRPGLVHPSPRREAGGRKLCCEAVAACIGGDAATVVEEVRDGGKSLTAEPELVESPRGLAAATVVQVGSLSALDKGKAAVLVESSRRPRGPVRARVNRKVAYGKKGAPVKLLPDGESYLTQARVSEILRSINPPGKRLPPPMIHKADVYSKHPKYLAGEFPCSAFMITGHGQEYKVWLFVGKNPSSRYVGGTTSDKWHTQTGGISIPDEEGKIIPWALMRNLSYKINCSTKKPNGDSTGWVMVEYWLTNQEEGRTDQIYVVYQSNRSYAQTPTADSLFPVAETRPSIEQGHDEAEIEDGASVDVSLGSPGAVSHTGHESITNLLVQAAEKATSCGNFRKACEVNEFLVVKHKLQRTIDQLGLDSCRFIISESLDKLKIRLHHVAIIEELTPRERDEIVSCGEHMLRIIQSANSDKRVKRERQEENALRGIGVSVHDQVSNTSAAPSSGVKRKADQDHPEAPPSMRQERADSTDPDGQEGTDQMSFSENGPMLAGGDSVGDFACGVTIGVPQVQPEEHGIAEMAEGYNGPCNALDDPDAAPSTDQERAVTENVPITMESDVVVASPSSTSEVPPEQQGLGPGHSGPENALEEMSELLLSGTMDAGGNYCGDPVGPCAHVLQGGEQAMPESAPSALTEVDAAQGSTTGPDCLEKTEHQLSQDNDLTAVGDPGELTVDFRGQFEGEESLQTPIDVEVQDYLQEPIDFHVAPEQLAEWEIALAEMLERLSPILVLGPSPGDMSGGDALS